MPRQIIVPRIHRQALTTPLELPGTAAWYDLSKPSSLIHDGSNRLQLVGDVSGNSAVNGLVLNGSSVSYASTPDSSAVSITGDMDIRAKVALNDWTPSAKNQIVAKITNPGAQYSFSFLVDTNGTLIFAWWSNSTGPSGGGTATSTIAPTVADYASLHVRVTLDVDNGAAGWSAVFYTSLDGVVWTQLGATITTAGVTSIGDSTAPLQIGCYNSGSEPMAGIIYYVELRNGIGGTIAFRADFTAQSKLATSFTESSANAATVTITTVGDTGARICGARDLVQMTQAKMPILTLSPGGNFATYDGSNDYDKSAPYSLSQPCTRYTAFKIGSWTSGKIPWDGDTAGSAKVSQTGTTPNLQLNAGSAGPQLNTFTLGSWAVMVETINGASSALQRNRDAAATGDAGATNPGGGTMGADGAGANNAPLVWSERIIRTGADSALTKQRIVAYLLQKWAIAP